MKTLIAYYTRSGFTRQIAATIAQACDGDLEEIHDHVNRSGAFGFLRSGYEAVYNKRPSIDAPRTDASQYDLVVIGTPVWAGKPSSPVRTYLMANCDRFSNIAFFCTYGGSGAERVFRQMADLCHKEPVATLEITDDEINHRTFTEKAQAFAATITALPPRAVPPERPGVERPPHAPE